MKKLTILIVLILFGWTVRAQISGGFYYGNDMYGNTYAYFQGSNTSQYNYDISITCRNDALNQERTFYLTPLYSGRNFTIGPTDGWIWQPGEKLYITYSNGKIVYWVYGNSQSQSNPSFTGYGACTYYNSVTRQRCNCSGYSGDYGKGPCKKCGHKYVDHTR